MLDKPVLNYRLSRELVADIKALYALDQEEEKGIQPEIFIDTAGIIDMLLGLEMVCRGEIFRRDLLNEPSMLVYAMCHRGWLGTISLLAPHTEELIWKLRDNQSPPFHDSVRSGNPSLENELWYWVDPSREIIGFVPKDDKERKRWLTRLKAESPSLFKAFYLLEDHLSWKTRFKSLKENNIINLSIDPHYRLNEITDSAFFRELLEFFNRERTWKSSNNYLDAVALCLLDTKLRAFEQHSKDGTAKLPLFFSDQQHILNAVRHFAAKPREDGSIPFACRLNGEQFPIVMDANFFILYGVKSEMKRKKNIGYRSFFEHLDNHMTENPAGGGASPWESKLLHTRRQLLENRRNFVRYFEEKMLVEFFNRWWEDARENEIERLFEPGLDPEAKKQREKEVNDFIAEERQRLEDLFEPYKGRMELIKKIWDGFQEMKSRIETRFPQRDERLDVYKELALRFSYPEETCEDIQTLVNEIYNAVHSKDEPALENHKANVVTFLLGALFDDLEHPPNPAALKLNLKNLGKGLAVLWTFEFYDLVSYICTLVRNLYQPILPPGDKYPDATTAMLHAAAILLGNNPDRKKANVIVECVRGKFDQASYKVQIGLSYVYYLLWLRTVDSINFPELARINYPGYTVSDEAAEYLNRSIYYSKAALNWLETRKRDFGDEAKTKYRDRRYFYALNNYLFFITMNENPDNFKEMVVWARKLEESGRIDDVWQDARFSDTLARFYFRLALLATEKDWFSHYLQQGIAFNKRSLGAGIQAKNIYQHLERELTEAKLRGFEGIKTVLQHAPAAAATR